MSNVLLWPDTRLKKPAAEEVDFGPELAEIVESMRNHLKVGKYLGLSACQIGHSKRVFLAALGEGKDFFDKEVVAFVNPSITSHGRTIVKSIEECQSLPGIRATIKSRRRKITVAAFDISGLPFQDTYIGFDSVIIQHEIDHLDGKTLLDRVGQTQRMMLRSKLRKIIGKR